MIEDNEKRVTSTLREAVDRIEVQNKKKKKRYHDDNDDDDDDDAIEVDGLRLRRRAQSESSRHITQQIEQMRQERARAEKMMQVRMHHFEIDLAREYAQRYGSRSSNNNNEKSSVSTSMTGLPKFKGVGTNTSLGDLEEDNGRNDVLQESLSHEMAEVKRQEHLVMKANEDRDEMKTEMEQLREVLNREKEKLNQEKERLNQEKAKLNQEKVKLMKGIRKSGGDLRKSSGLARASIDVRGSYTTDSEWDREEDEEKEENEDKIDDVIKTTIKTTTTPKVLTTATTPETNMRSVRTEFLREDEEDSSDEPDTPVKRLLTSTVGSLGDTIESHTSLKVELDALRSEEDESFGDDDEKKRINSSSSLGDTGSSLKVELDALRSNDDDDDDDVEFDSPKGTSMWKKWSRQTIDSSSDVIVTSSPLSRERGGREVEEEEFLLSNSASSRILKHEMRVRDVDEGSATDDNPDRGFGSTDEFHGGTTTDMSGEFLNGGVTPGTSLQSTDFDVSDVTSVTALSTASGVTAVDGGGGGNSSSIGDH